MIVLSIGTDRKIFEEGSHVRARMVEYGKLFTELHIIIFTLEGTGFRKQKISDNVWIYPTKSKKRWRYPFDARTVFFQEMANVQPHVVTAQDPFETGLAAWLIRRKKPMKLHVQIHTDFMSPYFARQSGLNRLRVMIARWLLPKADGVRAVSDRIKQSLAKIKKTLPAKTTVLPIYTDISAFKDAPVLLDLHGMYPQFSFIILMASRLTPEKNIGFALALLKEIIIKYPNVGLVIVGEGSDQRYLQGLALRYHVDRNVVFEPWQTNLASYYRTADVFLTTSLYEGYGLTLIEAAASGCPIVASDVGIVKQIVEQGVNGYVCDLAHQHTFLEKLMAMIADPELTATLKKAADTLAHQRVSEPHSVYLTKYKEMLEHVVQ
jgi:glycosyltransferase involved in cell wall biosynthesis